MKGAHEYPDQVNEQRLDRFEKRLYIYCVIGIMMLCMLLVIVLWRGYSKYVDMEMVIQTYEQYPYRYDVIVYNGNADSITYHATSAYKHDGMTYVTLTSGEEVVIKNKRYVEIVSVEQK